MESRLIFSLIICWSTCNAKSIRIMFDPPSLMEQDYKDYSDDDVNSDIGDQIEQLDVSKRSLEGIGQGNLLGRSLEGVGQGNLLGRSLEGIGQGHLLGRSLDLSTKRSFRGQFLKRKKSRNLFRIYREVSPFRRSLEGIGNGNLLGRSLEGLGQGNLLD